MESEFKQVKIDNPDHPEMIADFITMSDIELQKILASCALLAQKEVEQYLYGEKETPTPQAKPEEIVDKSLNFSEATTQILAKLLECVHNLNTNPSLVSSNEINQLELKYTELYTQFKDDLELHTRFSYLAGTFTKCNMLIKRAKELKKL